MTKQQRELVFKQAVANTDAATDILVAARQTAPRPGIVLLKGAHIYLYAALLSDFVHDAKQAGFIGPTIQMNDGTVKSTEQFLIDHCFGTLLAPLFQSGGAQFLTAVRAKVDRLVFMADSTEKTA